MSNCPSCSDALTYDRLNVQNTDGVYAFDNGNAVSTVANGGVTINPVAADRCNGPVFTAINIPTTVDVELDYTVPSTLCGAGPYYVVGVINPAPTLHAHKLLLTISNLMYLAQLLMRVLISTFVVV